MLRRCGYEFRATVSSENHRVFEEARNLWTSPGPASLLKQGHLQLPSTMSRWLLSISKNGDVMVDLLTFIKGKRKRREQATLILHRSQEDLMFCKTGSSEHRNVQQCSYTDSFVFLLNSARNRSSTGSLPPRLHLGLYPPFLPFLYKK